MANIYKYKGYQTKVEFDAESCVLYGKIEGIRDLVNFESDTVNGVKAAFQEAVDDYLEFCSDVGKEPDKEYSGQFNVRISSDLHRKLAMKAFIEGETLNREVQNAIEQYLDDKKRVPIQPIFIVRPESIQKGVYNSNTWMSKQNFYTKFWENNNISQISTAQG